jgi:cytochrome c heme-lyase
MENERDSPPSGCPVRHNNSFKASSTSKESGAFWRSLLPVTNVASQPGDGTGGVGGASKLESPLKAETRSYPNERTLVASTEEVARYAQTPQPDQTVALDTNRQISSIPRGSGSAIPTHQDHVGSSESTTEDNHWVYPSEQQMYNAMRKKGWSNIPEDSIPTVLQIHNTINERTWRQIQDWEGSDSLNLVSFQGRPRDVTPKAYLLCHVLRLYEPPFDRHDWYVGPSAETPSENTLTSPTAGASLFSDAFRRVLPSSPQRYVIDYYYLPPEHPSLPPTPYVDARPALDHPRALWLHGRRFLRHAFPGITAYLDQHRQK